MDRRAVLIVAVCFALLAIVGLAIKATADMVGPARKVNVEAR